MPTPQRPRQILFFQKCEAAMADRTVLIPVHELYVEGPIDKAKA